MTTSGSIVAALRPVRESLRASAAAEADRLLAAVEAETAAQLRAARERADVMVQRARTEGAADAAIALAGARARARRRARATVQRARRDAYQQLRAASREAVHRMLDEPGYPALRGRLATAAAARLGPGSTVADDQSGVVAETPNRRVDYSLDGFADRAVDQLGAELEGLWTP